MGESWRIYIAETDMGERTAFFTLINRYCIIEKLYFHNENTPFIYKRKFVFLKKFSAAHCKKVLTCGIIKSGVIL